MAPSLASKLYTLFSSTLVSIQAFFIWLFASTPNPILQITPYPFRPDLEGRVLDISLSSIEAQTLDISLQLDNLARSSSAPSRRRAASAPTTSTFVTIPLNQHNNAILPLCHSRRFSDTAETQLKTTSFPLANLAAPRSFVVPPPPQGKSTKSRISLRSIVRKNKENHTKQSSPALPVARKPLAFKPASRYLHLVANSPVVPTVSTSVATSGPSLGLGNYSYPRRRSIIGRADAEDKPETEDPSNAFDFAARVKSAFYGCRALDDDDCDAREFFKRDSSFGCQLHDQYGGEEQTQLDDLTVSTDSVYDASFNTSSIVDGSFAFSATSSDSSSSIVTSETSILALPVGKLAPLTPNTMILHHLQTSSDSSSELPYLSAGDRTSNGSMACELSMLPPSRPASSICLDTSHVFSDLLASLECKFPGTELSDLEGIGGKYRGAIDPFIVEDEDGWSEVVSLANSSL
ncbi:hypothetical protein MIND_00307800 [Mycena indigotica]|uniref:Uncharacterized protein n=1 Tax=Mycena indigotica TaxID=2126181 RepID=A0A8H6T4P4_9AGAR|nr:uncharacterized protein MIND_00307800 [Mycena indigotica]KAF7309370.1 hypothetical protein MIND_00307800 [Mycena indigotica]